MRPMYMHVSPQDAVQAQRVVGLARDANDLSIELAAARVLDAFEQNRPVSFEDVVSLEKYGLPAHRLSLGVAGDRERNSMAQRKKVEIFSAGCDACREAITTVRCIAAGHEIEVLDMHQDHVAARARQHDIRRVPSVVVDGQLANCCTAHGVDEVILKSAIA